MKKGVVFFCLLSMFFSSSQEKKHLLKAFVENSFTKLPLENVHIINLIC